MGDRLESFSCVRTSEDKVCRKDMCWSVRAVVRITGVSDPRGEGVNRVANRFLC